MLKGTRALRNEEEAARALLESLDSDQKKIAVVDQSAPDDIRTAQLRRADRLAPVGLASSRLSDVQKKLLWKLVDVYAGSMSPEIARTRMKKAREADGDRIGFAWAGSTERGARHYYRVQGPTFLIEYDNTQNDANHIHSVWRDFDGDFGRDLLAEHLSEDEN